MHLQSTLTFSDCLPPELVCAYVHHLVSWEQAEAIESHARHCDECLLELQEAVRIVLQLWPPQARGHSEETK
jgi:hypothetical protein